jgi:hypothetical protein
MKTFARHKTLEEVQAQCAELGVPLDLRLLEGGDDCVTVGHPDHGHAVYNVTNGRFFGKSDLGLDFSSDEAEYDDHEWYQQLLNFFMVP